LGDMNGKFGSLRRILGELGKVVVAYSGGVNSTFLLKVAVDTLGLKFIAVDLQGFRSGSLNEMLSEDNKMKKLN
jgi:uncharacterized protein